MRSVDKKAFGKRVAAKRKARGLSQPALAEAVGMSQQGINNLEQGVVQRPRGLIELAAALRTTPEWLLYGEGIETVAIDNPQEQLAAALRDLDADQVAVALQFLRRLRQRNTKVA